MSAFYSLVNRMYNIAMNIQDMNKNGTGYNILSGRKKLINNLNNSKNRKYIKNKTYIFLPSFSLFEIKYSKV